MIDWDTYFGPTPGGASGGAQSITSEEADNTQRNLEDNYVLLPWITFTDCSIV